MKKFLKFTGITLAVLVVLAVIAYFTVSSQWFIKSQVLPRVAAAVGAPVTAETVSFSPLSCLEMTGIRVGDPAKPLAEVKTLRVRYDALAVLSKKIVVAEMLVDGAKLSLEQKSDGAWNLPKSFTSTKTTAPASTASAAPFPYALDIRNVRITNAELSFTQAKPVPTTVTVRDVNLTIPAVQPGKPFELTLAALATAARNGETLADKMPVTAHVTCPPCPKSAKSPRRSRPSSAPATPSTAPRCTRSVSASTTLRRTIWPPGRPPRSPPTSTTSPAAI